MAYSNIDNEGVRHRSQRKTYQANENVEDLNKYEIKHSSPWKRFVSFFTQPEDPANLGIFRILFGILMMVDIPQERGMANVHFRWEDPTLCYFPLFNWLKPLSVDWMYVVYLVMFLAALSITLGCCYRASCLLFILFYWYVFFLDKGAWNNHSYLYGLISIMLLLTDANRYWSIDGLFQKAIRNTCVPRWNYWIIKFQIFLVYFFAGLKKLDLDWMSGYSMLGLSKKWVFDPFRFIMSDHFIDLYMVHVSGLILDLSLGFLLLLDKTRAIAVFFGSMFHLMNSQLFSIGMFPWTMLATMPFFFRSDWPRVLSRKMPGFLSFLLPLQDDPKVEKCFTETTDRKQEKELCVNKSGFIRKNVLVFLASFYVLVQLFLPWSHFITQGYNGWTNGLYGYSWDMMVHSWSTQHIRIEVVDRATNDSHFILPGVWVGGKWRSRWSSKPDMVKQYATCLARKIKGYEDLNITEPAIYVDVWRSMNQRFQQRMFDPRVDIVKAPWSPFARTPWVLPLLIDFSSWRTKLEQIQKEAYEKSNFTEVVFVADFPGLHLENFVNADLNASVTVLDGTVRIDDGDRNVTLGKGGVYLVKTNDTHIVHTISDTPSCWMYTYINVTLSNNVTLQNIAEAKGLSYTGIKNGTKWTNMTAVEKFQTFMTRKFDTFSSSFLLAYEAVQNIVVGRNESGQEEPEDTE